jgi:deazaflavin-dependent oxidoreductase (nitroreductase family)
MVEKMTEVKPPSGVTRWLFRLPLSFYKLGFGWMLGSRFVQMTHTGRVTGKIREVVLEVIKQGEMNGVYYVVAAWGERADWFQNIKANPQIEYRVAREHFGGHAEVIAREEAEIIFVEYGERHPRMLQGLMRTVGFRIERDEKSYRALAEYLPIVKLVPDREGRG